MKKILTILTSAMVALVLFIGTGLTVNAAGTGTITITPPTGTDKDAVTTYQIYKVFDADGNGTNISYKLLSGKSTSDAAWTSSSMGTYFDVDTAGNVTAKDAAKDETDSNTLSAGAINAIKAYVTNANITAEYFNETTENKVYTATTSTASSATQNVNAKGAGANNATKATGLANGYYYITTTTGTVVTIDSTNPNASVNDKNTVTTVDDKKVTTVSENGSTTADGHTAIAELGSTVSFQATVTFGKGAKNVKFHDTMTEGLTFKSNSIVVSFNPELAEGTTGYTVLESPDVNDTFTIKFTDGIPEGTKATISYTATVTSGELTTNPATNKAHTTYGDNNNTTSDKEVDVYNAKFTVTKHDSSDNGLANAGFVIKNSNNQFYKKNGNDVEWVNSIEQATEYFSKNDGKLYAGTKSTASDGTVTIEFSTTDTAEKSFTGLDNGTYTLVESTVPAGYNKAADYQFTINPANTTTDESEFIANLNQSTTVVNSSGTSLPSTGGIGTTVFYVGGIAIVAIAAGLLLARRKRA